MDPPNVPATSQLDIPVSKMHGKCMIERLVGWEINVLFQHIKIGYIRARSWVKI